MCGIVGMVGNIYAKEQKAFEILSKLDTIRGEDSVGICSVTKDFGDWETLKDIGTPFGFFELEGAKKLMGKCNVMLFGHNRAATKGAVNIDNAHPFSHGDFIGCHNGTLNSCYNLEDHDKFKVDSENIFYDMSVNGHIETLKKLNGAFALCWYNSKLNTINLVRNNDRPLFYCYSKSHKTLFWASESWMLHVALEKVGIERDGIEPLTIGKLMTVQLPVVAGVQITDIKETQEDVEFYKVPYFRGGGYFPWGLPEKKETYTPGKEKAKKGGNVINLKNHWSSVRIGKKFLGKFINFSVVGLTKTGNLEYILCDVEDEAECPELRVFTPKDQQLGMNLLTSPRIFTGKVKSFTTYGRDVYLVCDNRTITEVVNEDEVIELSDDDFSLIDPPEKIIGYRNEELSLKRYFQLTSSGCACCGNIASLREAEDLMWVNKEDYFCKNCRNTNVANQYRLLIGK